LGWTPSYLISLNDDKTAQITMQAVVMDDAEDLDNTDVFFCGWRAELCVFGDAFAMACSRICCRS